jgi:hypothetical protein
MLRKMIPRINNLRGRVSPRPNFISEPQTESNSAQVPPLKIYEVTHTRVALTVCFVPATSQEEAEQFIESDTFAHYLDSDLPDKNEDIGDPWKVNNVEETDLTLDHANWRYHIFDYQKEVLPTLKEEEE